MVVFLRHKLKLELHQNKVSIETLASGIDFLGWIHFSYHRILRETTKRRMLRNLRREGGEASTASYLGLLRHGNAHKLASAIKSVNS